MLPMQGACVESLVRELDPTGMPAPSKTQVGRGGRWEVRERKRERERKEGRSSGQSDAKGAVS